MHIELRPERPADYRAAENMTREAFWNHYCPGCDEHYLLHIMRNSPAFLPELSIVALDGEKIIGNVVHMRAYIQDNSGEKHEVLSLGPIAVLPEYQRKGIGGKLIEHSRQLARAMGFRAVLLYGDPAYYSRQGFSSAEALGIRTSDNMYADALQVCELYKNALAGIAGRYHEGEVYTFDTAAAKAFDKGFPPKELTSGTPSQLRFAEIASRRRAAD